MWPHPHYDAHPLALIGEGEYLQDGEVQDLASRGPQLHGGLVSAHQRQPDTLGPLHQRHLPAAQGHTLMDAEGVNLYKIKGNTIAIIFFIYIKKVMVY